MRKRQHTFFVPHRILAGFLLLGFPFFVAVFGIWSTNSPSNLGIYFPEGTQIIEQTDTHKGLFRKEGVAIVVAQLPQGKIQTFGQQLQDEGFVKFPPLDHVREVLERVEAAAPILQTDRALWTCRDEALAFVEEPFSDYFAAAYDLETGLCCCVEYDS